LILVNDIEAINLHRTQLVLLISGFFSLKWLLIDCFKGENERNAVIYTFKWFVWFADKMTRSKKNLICGKINRKIFLLKSG